VGCLGVHHLLLLRLDSHGFSFIIIHFSLVLGWDMGNELLKKEAIVFLVVVMTDVFQP
jgi:hypothetical protein